MDASQNTPVEQDGIAAGKRPPQLKIAGVERVEESGTSQDTVGPIPDPTLNPFLEVGPWTYGS